jgi:hypothetical protein
VASLFTYRLRLRSTTRGLKTGIRLGVGNAIFASLICLDKLSLHIRSMDFCSSLGVAWGGSIAFSLGIVEGLESKARLKDVERSRSAIRDQAA